MKKLWLAICLLTAGFSFSARADVKISLKLEFESYLQYERIMAVVTIYNDAESALSVKAFTNTASGLRFLIKKNKQEEVKKNNELPLLDGIELASGEKEEHLIDIAGSYNMGVVGNYEIVAELYTPEKSWRSERALVDIVPGLEIASLEKNVPGYPDRMRQYSLRYWARKGKEYLFLRVDEKENELVYGVFLLGPVIRVVAPKMEVDRQGNIVIVHQTASEKFARTLLKSEAFSIKFVDQTYFDSQGKSLDQKDSSAR